MNELRWVLIVATLINGACLIVSVVLCVKIKVISEIVLSTIDAHSKIVKMDMDARKQDQQLKDRVEVMAQRINALSN